MARILQLEVPGWDSARVIERLTRQGWSLYYEPRDVGEITFFGSALGQPWWRAGRVLIIMHR